MGALRAIAAQVDTVLLGQRGHLLHWSPVFFGLGIGVYFALRVEPGMQAYLAVGCLGALCGVIAALRPGGWAALFWAVTLTAAGFTSAGWRAASVAAPVLDFRYYGPVEGRVVGIDRSNSDAVRVTLDQVRLPKERGQWPERARISFHGGFETDVAPGQRIMTTGYLSPPQGSGRARRLRFSPASLVRPAGRGGLHPQPRPDHRASGGGAGGSLRLRGPHGAVAPREGGAAGRRRRLRRCRHHRGPVGHEPRLARCVEGQQYRAPSGHIRPAHGAPGGLRLRLPADRHGGDPAPGPARPGPQDRGAGCSRGRGGVPRALGRQCRDRARLHHGGDGPDRRSLRAAGADAPRRGAGGDGCAVPASRGAALSRLPDVLRRHHGAWSRSSAGCATPSCPSCRAG